MNKREYAKLKKWTDTLTDEQLKKEYYDAFWHIKAGEWLNPRNDV